MGRRHGADRPELEERTILVVVIARGGTDADDMRRAVVVRATAKILAPTIAYSVWFIRTTSKWRLSYILITKLQKTRVQGHYRTASRMAIKD